MAMALRDGEREPQARELAPRLARDARRFEQLARQLTPDQVRRVAGRLWCARTE